MTPRPTAPRRRAARPDSPTASRAGGTDRETRERLFHAAMRLFAEHGFAAVTVRDICGKARANVAAVNYHFGGKQGLYEEVVHAAIRAMHGTTEAARTAGAGRPPDEQLALYVSVFLQRVHEGRDSWIHQLMTRELADPTPALDLVIEHVLRPRMDYLAGIVAALMERPLDDARVRHCVLSVHAQCLAVMRNPLGPRMGLAPTTSAELPAVAERIARFSIAGIRAVGRDA